MKNKIKKFSKGDFRVVTPEIVFEETNLVLTIGEGEIYKGSFRLKDKKDGLIRGLVYASSYRMKLKNPGFEGNPVDIHFTYDGKGLKPGHVEHGRFTVVCNGGEFDIEYTIIIEKPYIMTSYGKIQNMRDFKKLALRDFTEAQRLFRSREFYEIIKYEEPRIKALYDNMRKWSLSEQAMEEFLVGIKQKECIFLTMNKTQRTFRNLAEATKEVIHFTKNTWGYMPIKIHVDGDFIHITKDFFTTDDFVGNLFDFSYIIQPDKCHVGNNFGSITFESPYESLTYEVLVVNHKDHMGDRRATDMIIASVMKGFLTSMSGRTTVKAWADDARKQLAELDIYTGAGDVYPLINAHLHVLCGEDKKADELLDKYSYSKYSIGKDPIVSAYYLYLTALVRKNVSYVNKVVEELNKAYMKNPKSWELICMLLDVDPEFKNYTRRIYVLERHFNTGANQILLYWQAFKCFKEHPSSMKKLGKFEIQVMNFAIKYKLMTKEVALYMANLASQQRVYDKSLDRVMRKTYEMYNDPQILTSVCTLMIRGNCISPDDFKWYEKAIQEDLKIAQLYEYYMMTIKDTYLKKELPKSVYFYFMHGNNLDYRKAALLFANVIYFQDPSGDLYENYREQIERFAWEQVEKRRISEALRIIYRRCCRESEMTKDRAQAFYDICHAYEVKTSVENIAFVMVLEADGTISQKVPYNSDGTTVLLFNKESRIIWEAKDGRRYVDSIPYDTMRLFYESRYIDMCKKYEVEMEEDDNRDQRVDITWDMLEENGREAYNKKDLFRLCSMKVREDASVENENLLNLCYELFTYDEFDKATLSYLLEFYCGPTANMKKLWHKAQVFELTSYKLSERIITQMLFSEMMFGEEEIFADYYDGRTYFRLKQAYLAYVSREYVVRGRQVQGCVFSIIAKEYRRGEELPDICKIALLKYYSSRDIHQGLTPMLQEFLREMCEKQLFFSFYLEYPVNWLREVQLYDKSMIEYHARPGSKVMISYQIKREGDKDSLSYKHEVLLPSYGDTYMKTFILFGDEKIKYYFTETRGDEQIVTEKKVFEPQISKAIGKYGRLNDMITMEDDTFETALKEFAVEQALAKEIFVAY